MPSVSAQHARAINRIIRTVARAYDLQPADIVGPDRSALVVEARRVVIRLLADAGYGPMSIGRVVQRDHSTVTHHLAALHNRPTVQELDMLHDLRTEMAYEERASDSG